MPHPRCIAPQCPAPKADGEFCAEHAKAPSAKRAGWTSAHRKAAPAGGGRALGPAAGVPLAARRLWYGKTPSAIVGDKFAVAIILDETTPDVSQFRGTLFQRQPPLSLAVIAPAIYMARIALGQRRRVFVGCADGQTHTHAFIEALVHALRSDLQRLRYSGGG